MKQFFLAFLMLLAISPNLTLAETNYSGQHISIDLQDANIDSVFGIISQVSGLNVVLHSDVQGKVTLRLNDVPWDQVLDIVLRQNGLYRVTEGNVMIIVPLARLPQLYFSQTAAP